MVLTSSPVLVQFDDSSLRVLCVLGDSAVNGPKTTHRGNAENAEDDAEVEMNQFLIAGKVVWGALICVKSVRPRDANRRNLVTN